MSRIFWDTNLFIYLLNGPDDPHCARVAGMLGRIEQRGDELLTSAVSLGEVLAGTSDVKLRAEWQLEIESSATVLPFPREAAAHFADLRIREKLLPADAMQLAIAALAGVDLFVTADRKLADISYVAGIQFLTSLERAPL